jgi:hypothetical protein
VYDPDPKARASAKWKPVLRSEYARVIDESIALRLAGSASGATKLDR